MTPLSAQTAVPLADAAHGITADAVARHIRVLAADSMRGREDSAGLARAARYIGVQWAQAGLMPAGDTGWQQGYPMTPRELPVDYATSRVGFCTVITRRGQPILTEQARRGRPERGGVRRCVSVGLSAAARFATEAGLQPVPQPLEYGSNPRKDTLDVLLVTGRHTPASLHRTEMAGKAVLYVPPAGLDSAARHAVIAQLYGLSRGVIVLGDEDSSGFARRARQEMQQPRQMLDPMQVPGWAVHVWPGALTGFLAAAQLDVAPLRNETTPAVHPLPFLRVFLDAQPQPGWRQSMAINVVGRLEGSDSVLKEQYVILSAHMDRGAGRRGADEPLDRGADDNASGTAGLLELAQAFTRPGARPRRSLLFVALSGTAAGLQGARWFVDRLPIDRQRIAADLNLDMLGRATHDTLQVDGMNDVVRLVRPDWLAAQHPELGLTVVDGGTVASTESDHWAFARAMIPALHFHTGTHETDDRSTDSPDDRSTDSPDAVAAAQVTRIVQLVFYAAHELANAAEPPAWSAGGRQARSLLRR